MKISIEHNVRVRILTLALPLWILAMSSHETYAQQEIRKNSIRAGFGINVFGRDEGLEMESDHQCIWGTAVKSTDIFQWICNCMQIRASSMQETAITTHWGQAYMVWSGLLHLQDGSNGLK